MARDGKGVTVGASAGAGNRNIDTERDETRRLAALMSHAWVGAVREAGPRQVQEVFDRLIAKGAAVYDDDSADEEPQSDLNEDEMDGELVLADEDAESVEASGNDGSFSDGTTPFVGDAFEILVVDDGDGDLYLDVPEDAWAGIRPVTNLARTCLGGVSARMRTYAEIGRYLLETCPDLLARGPEAFLQEHRPMRQTTFVEERLKDVSDVFCLSRALKHARLVWPEGSIPLRRLFE